MLVLRDYQTEAIESVNLFLKHKKGNPAIVLPTGSGKSLVMAKMISNWVKISPKIRVMVLAHRKELVEQNYLELKKLDSVPDIGIYSAGLNKRQTQSLITFASIDSVYNKCNSFQVQTVFIIDEAHRIPVRGEGKYRKLIVDMTLRNPNLKVIGLTATPYRLGTGNICHQDYILNEVCYEARIKKLIDDGYLCPVRTIEGDHSELNLDGVQKIAGEYNSKQLSDRVNREEVVNQAVEHLVLSCNRCERKSVIVFCIDVDHCKSISTKMESMGIKAPYIIGKTKASERTSLLKQFKDGKVQFLLSVDCFFEGFNAPGVDCVAMLRPTQSKGLWVQAIGRGLRTKSGKSYCLILDYGDNIQRHGPIDMDQIGDIVLEECKQCSNQFNKRLGQCPSCGWEIPKQERKQMERLEEVEKKIHNAFAAKGELFASQKDVKVTSYSVRVHRKLGKPDSVRIDFLCGLTTISHWVTVEHKGYARDKAKHWLNSMSLPFYDSCTEMIKDERFQSKLETIKTLSINTSGKYPEIISYN
tara:strand:+ start:3294 stop:4877 length:1584 start_codon:yes stop_codon:yes gene_type:complete